MKERESCLFGPVLSAVCLENEFSMDGNTVQEGVFPTFRKKNSASNI